jgi:hemerythrin-like metal-binding protein
MATIATWSNTFASGIDEIDAQHEAIFEALDAFFVAVKTGRGEAVLRETLGFLQRYSEEHFAEEEALMEELRYPWELEHKRQPDDRYVNGTPRLQPSADPGQHPGEAP